MPDTLQAIFQQALTQSTQRFPEIHHITSVLDAIEGRSEFCIHSYGPTTEDGGYRVLDYRAERADTFAPPEGEDDDPIYALRRECRGLIFAPDGTLCCRKYHKFFHIGQLPETALDAIDWSAPFWVLEKLDGTLVAPVAWGEHMVWTTRGGPSPIAQQAADWIVQHPKQREVIAAIVGCGWTPLLEWCSRQHPIALDYPESRLVLTAIRHNRSGTYLPYPAMVQLAARHGLDCIASRGAIHGLEEAQALVKTVASQTEGEGVILRAEDGRLYKLKSDLYKSLHDLLAHSQPEKFGWQLAFNDESTPLLCKLPAAIAVHLTNLQRLLESALIARADEMHAFIQDAKAAIAATEAPDTNKPPTAKDRFAKEWLPRWEGPERHLLFKLWEGQGARSLLFDRLQGKLRSTKGIRYTRELLGLAPLDLLSLALPLLPETPEQQPASAMMAPGLRRADGRTIIIGDIHGCLDELQALLDLLGVSDDDHLVFVGDLVDHGPDSAGVVHFLVEQRRSGRQISLVQGNHESMMISRRKKWRFRHQLDGIVEEKQKLRPMPDWAAELSEKGWAFLEDACLYLPLPEHNALVVHAGISSNRHALPLSYRLRDLAANQQRAARRLQLIRYERQDGSHIRDIKAGKEREGDWYWAQRYDGRFGHVYYGHHPYFRDSPMLWPHATGLDLACVIGGRLAAAILPKGATTAEFATYKAHRPYSPPHKVEEWADVRLGLTPMPTLPGASEG